MLVNDCVLGLKSQEGSIPGTGIDPSLSLWLHKVATCVPPRDLERTPCRHPCWAENLLVKVYHNPQRMQNDVGSAFATQT
jgi:hypothetical protein